MSKRKNKFHDDSQVYSKFRNILTPQEDIKLFDNQYRIPIEMIAFVMSKVTNIEDLKNCMRLSREVRQQILKTPEAMRNIRYVVNYENLNYFQEQRLYIRCLRIKVLEDDNENLRLVLNNMPNLEDLTLEFISCSKNDLLMRYFQKLPAIPDLSKLKTLKICLNGLEKFIENSRNVKNLEKLTILSSNVPFNDYVEELINQQKYKHKLQLTCNNEADDLSLRNFEPFGDYLRTLELRNLINPDTRHVNFDKFKKVTKISCLTFNLMMNRMFNSQNFCIPSVTTFECKTGIITSQHLKVLDMIFPNLKTIKCADIDARDGSCDNLQSLEIDYLSFPNFQHCKFPNLKYLSINFSLGLFQNEFWKNSIENLPNVENVTICGYFSEIEARYVIPQVKGFKNLKKFMFVHKNNVNCKVVEDQIVIDRTRGTVRLCKYIIQNYKQVMKIVYENFIGYKIEEII